VTLTRDTAIMPLVQGSVRARAEPLSSDTSEDTQLRLTEAALRDARARLEATLRAADAGTWTWDIPANQVVADRNLARLFEVSESDAAGAPIERYLAAIHPEDLGRVQDSIRASLEGSTDPYECEYRVMRTDGGIRWVIARGNVERDAEGKPVALPGIVIDITGRKLAENAVRDSAEHLQLALAAADLGDWQWEAHSDIVLLSDRAADMFGLPRGKVITWTRMRDLLVDDDAERARRGVEVALATQTDYDVEYRVVRPSGERCWIAARGRGLYTESGAVVGMIGIVQDITSRKQTEESLRDIDRRKDEFLATLAHELRNPLAPIRHAAQISRISTATEAQKRWSHEVIIRQVQHMSLLLDDLLDISRITRGTLELKLVPTDLEAAIEAAVETARPSIEMKRHRLFIDVPSSHVKLAADPLRLAQVLSNLLTNAAKYTDPDGEIRLSARAERDSFVIRVADTGIGIAPETLPSVFEMFAQVHGRDRSEGGLGIGLALSKGLVELHGGALEARSEGAGLGSEFIVRLPHGVSLQSQEPPTLEAAPELRNRRRVLIADDNRDGAESLAILLRVEGHDVSVVHDGAAALVALERLRPEVALLDIGMPGLNGYEVAQRVRESPTGRDILLVAITGWGQDSDKVRAIDAGFDHHFTKPIEPDRITALLGSS
jgi:PAS domain S-box-containing protein